MRPAGRHVAVFLRAPRLGRVKGRLARDIGPAAAWRFYRRLVRARIVPLARDSRWALHLATTPAAWRGRDRFWPLDAPRIDQGTGDLGRRMARVFRALPPGPALIVGSDIPALAPRHLAQAFALMGRSDAVFGPSADGGYWLVGLGAHARRLDPFRAVRWSSADALADTLGNLPPGARTAFLEPLVDVDDGPSLRHWLAQASATHSISISNSMGQEAMATKVRAGGSWGK